MVRIREVPRTATFAWLPGPGKPMLVTGTRAGAVDADFSDESKLELWDLALDNPEQGVELQPVASVSTDAKFYGIAWGPPDSEHPRGVIAGALENGSLDLWDAAKLESGDSDALISHTTKHSGPIKAIQFNPLKPHILATAGAKGEIFIYDVNDISNPFRLGNAAARSDDIECLAWNRKVSHILATGNIGGLVSVWDLKTKKASLTLNNSRKPVSSIAWDPNNSTKLLTATPDDNTSVILLWDLRNSNAPERTLQGHEQGVLSLSWCSQDSDLLLSSGKDNRTLVWNPQTGERYGELHEMSNWAFLTAFNPHNPDLTATASFDGKIAIQTLQTTNADATKESTESRLDGEEFFRAAQTQPQGVSWSLSKAPAWLERPIGASFGFGGKIVVFKASAAQPGQKRSSKIIISTFSADSGVSSVTEKFQQALSAGNITEICEERIEKAQTEEEKADWRVMEGLVGDNPRSKIAEYLGFNKEDMSNGTVEEKDTDGEKETTAKPEEDSDKKKEVSDFFGGGDGDGDGDDFLSNVTATKGAKTDNPFHLFSDSDTSVEKGITKALILGNFAEATEMCLAEERMADAFLIANCGGQDLLDKVQAAYLAKKSGIPSYMRLLSSVIDKNLWDIVYNANLENWKEAMAIISTFSDPVEFPDLCEALGDRINDEGQRKDASFCYLVGSKLEKVVKIWIAELDEAEQAGMTEASEDSTFSVHARALQDFIEKVTVFRHVSKFQDTEQSDTSGWTLGTLYDKYTEYADILAGQGMLEVAEKYLDLLPSSYPAADIARSRVKLARQKPRVQAGSTTRQMGATKTAAARVTPAFQPSQQPPMVPSSTPYGGMMQPPAPVSQPTTQQPYVPSGNRYQPSSNQYRPSGGNYQPGYSMGVMAPPATSRPPRHASPSQPPPPAAKKTENWNDVPFVTQVPSRRPTPSAAPSTAPTAASPYVSQPMGTAPPPPAPYGRHASPPAPPPKGPAPARVQSPLAGPPQVGQTMPPPRASSTVAAQYAPQSAAPGAPSFQSRPSPTVPRVASPYNAPPAAAPPNNRYAPAPAQHQNSQSQMPPMASPPPAAIRPPPMGNAYGAVPPPPPQGLYAPPAYSSTQAPPGGPASGPPPMSSATPTPSAPPPKAAAQGAPKARHPTGDRSYIPANAQRMVDILSQDMQRVASRAPATFAPQVKDTQKRLNLLFDHLNNGELVQAPTVEQLAQLAGAIQAKDYETAQRLQLEIQRDRADECGNWMVGVKRLISMSKATP